MATVLGTVAAQLDMSIMEKMLGPEGVAQRKNVLNITGTGAQVIPQYYNHVELNNTTQITATIADASYHPGLFTVSCPVEPGTTHTVTLTKGSWNGSANTATFADVYDNLSVVFDPFGNGTVVGNQGTVGLTAV